MKLKLVKASQGLVWVRQGMLASRKQPLGFVGLFGLMASAAMLLMGIQARLGGLLVIAAMPLMWMGFMLATRRVITGQRITPAVLIEAVRGPDSPRKAFATLGAAYVLGTMLVMQLAQWLGPDPDALDAVMEAAKTTTDVISSPLVQQDMLTRMVLTLPLSLLFWHTPALLLWAQLPVSKALFFSAVATWRNLPAFIVYGMAWGGVVTALALFDRALNTLLPEPLVGDLLTLVASMWVIGAFYASLYFTVVDCFEPQQAEGMPPEVAA